MLIFPAIFLCAGILFLGIWFGSFVFLITGRIRKSMVLTVGSGIVFGVLSTIVMVLAFSYVHATSPREVFRKSFGFDVPEDVGNIKSEYSYFMDSGYTFLTFNASPATVERISARGLTRAPNSYFPSSNIEPPEWWILPSHDNTVRYSGSFDNRDFAGETEVLIYDRSTGTVYFHFIGID